ncbi:MULTISPECIES: NAD(P)/FAD-dependent oxidoreductase [unclassified Flavobacterium]|uniref:protoporphyrinogen/coproporphyrinogen oxidase n=1 Tax=unclassified Flavobacterium TaxID=196869 RepID=UPI00131B0467|nr:MULTISPECIES: NAD(P)/FAD-dependent oxidoreductase [unclassified Flavobacterium]
MKQDVVIIGAGISGLTAAVYLHRQGRKVLILESSERAGGRIKTDSEDGFLFDRGFQVLLTAYPETKALLDYKALNLKKMLPGATVLYDKGSFEIADPFRRPSATLATLFAPVGSIKDKLNTLWLKNKLQKQTIESIFEQKEQTTLQQLKEYGFSSKMIERFYAPFLSGIFLENDLKTSSRMFDFVMKMFSDGDVAVPELGMEEIPKQLVKMLPEGSISYNTKVTKVDSNTVTTDEGKVFEANQILLATNANTLTQTHFPNQKMQSQQVTNMYFVADKAPTNKAVVVLNASTHKKWVNNMTVMTNVSKAYAPQGKILISVSYNGIPTLDENTLAENMKLELKQWYGDQVESWKMIKSYQIEYALPNQESVRNEISSDTLKTSENVFICGDNLLNGSINAAMKTGRLAAEAIMKSK